MALSGSSIVIVFIGVAAYAVAGPIQLQAGLNTLQQNEYGRLADLLARYMEDQRVKQSAKRNLDQIGGGHLVRDTDKQSEGLLNEEKSRLIECLNSAGDKQILDTFCREELFADRFRNGNLINSSINFVAFEDTINHPLNSPDLNADQANNELFMDQLINGDVSNNAESDRRIVKNLDQIGGRHFVRNLDQISNGHFIRNLDQIGGGHLVRSIDYPNTGTKQRIDQPMTILEKLHFTRNLDHIGGGNLVRNLDQIGGRNLVRNLDPIGGGNLVRSLN
ncbi:PREDICTED: uncharacterized protein LOC108760652 isoform X1 [Trachymyrmex cornetzi]|uniref:Uncharacterized protein n=1 Tax=Trachymyrmex cornetzi TaxID=471704 RepID=A0A195E557_9HYME|nr:PREDICTED: uncharacterized protein LOC108760652 isoform X1 [Trachymyrmex cornetzi]KYN20320.1 hypothetical protein ALC57_07224 [Trachymyrmex cornetzi]